jgi:hypothetical protein
MLRYLIFALLLFWLFKLITSLLTPGKKEPRVTGKAKSKPLDLSQEDIEDVDFKETRDE